MNTVSTPRSAIRPPRATHNPLMDHFHHLWRIVPCLVLIVGLCSCAPAWKSKDPAKRQKAVNRINDQALLARIASADENGTVCQAAVGRLTNLTYLAEIAIGHDSQWGRLAALNRLNGILSVTPVGTPTRTTEVQRCLLATALATESCAKVPATDYRKKQIMNEVTDLVLALSDPTVSGYFGDATIKVLYSKSGNTYQSQQTGQVVTMQGDAVTFIVVLPQLEKEFSEGWDTKFDSVNPYGTAEILVYEIAAKVFTALPPGVNEKVATSSPNTIARLAAVENVTNQVLLAEIAAKDSYFRVRDHAERRLQRK